MVNERAFDERLAALEVARAWSPRLVARLESHIRSSEDEALFRIIPLRVRADPFAARRSQALRASPQWVRAKARWYQSVQLCC